MNFILKQINKLNSNSDKEFDIFQKHGKDLFDLLPIEVAVYDLSGNHLYVNSIYIPDSEIRVKVIGKNDKYCFDQMGIDIDCAEERKRYFYKAIDENKTVQFTEQIHYLKTDKTRYFRRTYKPILNDKGEVSTVCMFGNDLTAVILGQKELKYLAFHDKVTGLRNKEGFYEELDKIALDAQRDKDEDLTAILLCDLDNFKLVNDSLGHDSGDAVIRKAASRLIKTLRKSDLVYRFGGDEFAVIVKHLERDYIAGQVAEKIISSLSKPYRINGHQITYITSSVGIAIVPYHGVDRESVVKKADTALHDAKKRGKNQYKFFSDGMTETSVKRMKIENNLRTLVKDNKYDHEFSLLYQPIVAINSKGLFRMIGAEALLRWASPELGAINPEKFIPVAEETNLISPMGDWILHKASEQINSLLKDVSESFYISINMSAKQLRVPDVVKKLEAMIKKTRLDPNHLQLELTETSYLEDQKDIVRNIETLNEMGINLAIDDFGIGFASLAYLQRIPATALKIDKSFIQNLGKSHRHEQLVKSIIDLGINLEKEVIAEGVESIDHFNYLENQRCTKFQGYLFSRPLTIEQLSAYIKTIITLDDLKK